jgi:glycosyltransferase involved in cell wall biosynthesis
MTSFTVIVPALNEEENLWPPVEMILGEFGRASNFLEILIFDDASSDRTGQVADELATQDPRVRVFHNSRRLNIGGIYKAGIREARGEYVLMIPGDNEIRVGELLSGAAALDRADVVIFYVTNAREARGIFRWTLSGLYVKMVNVFFGTCFRYTNGTNIFRTSILRGIPLRSDGFSYQTEAVVKAVRSGVDYVDVGIEIQARKHGVSKALSWKNLKSVVGALARLWWEVMVTDRRRYCRRGRKFGML